MLRQALLCAVALVVASAVASGQTFAPGTGDPLPVWHPGTGRLGTVPPEVDETPELSWTVWWRHNAAPIVRENRAWFPVPSNRAKLRRAVSFCGSGSSRAQTPVARLPREDAQRPSRWTRWWRFNGPAKTSDGWDEGRGVGRGGVLVPNDFILGRGVWVDTRAWVPIGRRPGVRGTQID